MIIFWDSINYFLSLLLKIFEDKYLYINFECLVIWWMCFFDVYNNEVSDIGKIVNNFIKIV